MNIKVVTKIKTRIMDAATGKCISERPWQKNLVMDAGLNGMAQGTAQSINCTPATSFTHCKVGSGTNPTKFPGGSVTFSQTTTAVVASSAFFTSGMVGAILKYGTDESGAEYYITAFIDSTHVTVNTSATVGAGTAATVWMVQQTALQTQLFSTNTYQTASGDCGTTFVGNTATFKRTFLIAQQGSPYTVNEIGWSPTNANQNVCGRVVLSSSDVVGTNNYYVVVIQISFTYSPGAPTAVGDVGTGINTAGNAMIEFWGLNRVSTTGTTTALQGAPLDNGGSVTIMGLVAAYTQESSITDTGTLTQGAGALVIEAAAQWANNGSAIGTMTLTGNDSQTTTGQTLRGFALRADLSPFNIAFDVKLTTPATLPVGTWSPTIVFQVVYGRTLDNA